MSASTAGSAMLAHMPRNGLKCLNAELPESCEAKLVPDAGRIYYLDHKSQSSSWLPPRENWDPGNTALPYGWEAGVDKNKKPYFINHLENYTTRDDPRDDPDYVEPPKPREVELVRDTQKGFGFVAGSEKPVVVRFVTEGGPSVDKLLPGDQLIKINGQDVKKAPREYVIDLVRSCKHSISLTVCQPYNDNKKAWLDMMRQLLLGSKDDLDFANDSSARKSALLTAAKKDRLKKNPSRVRFAEEIIVNGASVPSNSPEESYVPFMPNVLKVFLENGQTKSFKYDNKTTVKDVVNSLVEKLGIKEVHHFNLVLHNMKSHIPGHMILLQEHEAVSEIASRPGARHFRCLFRIVYVPKDSYDLLKQDPIAFEYFYMQCVNDVLQDRFASELKPDLILRLSALHIQQHAMSNNVTGKINIKSIEKEFGLEKFVPQSLRENMKVKDLRKVLAQSLKLNQNLTAPGQKQLTALQAKLHYMKIISELKTFGSRVFMVTLLDKKTEAMVLVGPKSGISLVTNVRFYTLSMLADFSEVQAVRAAKEKDNMTRVELAIKGDEPGTLNLGLLKDDATNFVSMVNGYFRIFVDPNQSLIQKPGRQGEDQDIPPFESKHTVLTAPWSYPEDIVSMVIGEQSSGSPDNERSIDLSQGPPAYEGNQEFISKLKMDLGIKTEKSTIPEVDEEKIDSNKSVKVVSPVRDTTGAPIKTVIEIKSPRTTIVDLTHPTSTDRNDSDSLSSGSSASASQGSEPSPEPVVKTTPRRRHRSPTPDARKWHELQRKREDPEYVNTQRRAREGRFTEDNENEEAPYVNNVRRGNNSLTKLDSGDNSDSDSGVGGEPEKQGPNIQDSERLSSSDRRLRNEDDGWGTSSDMVPSGPTITEKGRKELAMNAELRLDFSSLVDPSYGFVAADDNSPTSTTSPDIEDASFIGQYDPEQLPAEVLEAALDPRLFYNKEVYLDPDIIDLTLIPPFPPTQDELTQMTSGQKVLAGPQPSPSPTAKHHPRLLKATSVIEASGQPEVGTNVEKPQLQKSASVGYCPDFLDDDIDEFINKVTVQPPPSESKVTEVEHQTTDSVRLGQSWDGPMEWQDSEGLGYDNPALSKTVDLGQLALDDSEYSSLVIPPPPESSYSLEDIPIVPPVESVKDRRKKFEGLEKDTLTSGKGSKITDEVSGVQTNDSKYERGEYSAKAKGMSGGQTTDSSNIKDNDLDNNSPASVSEKLNKLLESLSSMTQEEEEPKGKLRRTSSLRLGRCASLDFLNPLQSSDTSKHNDLVTGSVRVKPMKVRPSLEHSLLHQNGSVHVPLRASSSDGVNRVVAEVGNNTKSANNKLASQRTQSFDVLPVAQGDQSDSDNPVSDFASLKAKLQSYRDSLLNRSLRRKKNKMETERSPSEDREKDEGQSPLKRSNSFSNLIRRSIKRSSIKESKSGRSSSATRDTTAGSDETKENGTMTAREQKIWNTLTTPRSTFRPNTASTSQRNTFPVKIKERLAPKPPLPTGAMVDRGEGRKQKAGPLKALSKAFDDNEVEVQSSLKASNSEITKEKSPKRQAPEVPKPFPTTFNFSQSRSQNLPPTLTLTKPLTIPLVPPRRKHLGSGNNPAEQSKHKSKDDSDIIQKPVASSDVKISPFATLGKMWRPMSMGNSVSIDADLDQEVTFRTFNNFDALREMSEEMIKGKQQTDFMPNGHAGGIPASTQSPTSTTSSPIETSSRSSNSDERLVSERSFALLKEKVSANHSNAVKRILDSVYTSEDFVQATNDVDSLLNEVKQTMESLKSSRIDRKSAQFTMCKEELQSQVRQFVTDAKLLVSNATQTKQKLASNMDASMHSLAKIFLHGQATMFMMEAIHQAQHLGSEVIRVANAYKSTLNAAHAAVGKPLSDPHMKYLMRQATNLASLLSNLLKSLKTLEQK